MSASDSEGKLSSVHADLNGCAFIKAGLLEPLASQADHRNALPLSHCVCHRDSAHDTSGSTTPLFPNTSSRSASAFPRAVESSPSCHARMTPSAATDRDTSGLRTSPRDCTSE